MSQLLMYKRDELEEIIIKTIKDASLLQKPERKENMNIDDAVKYLNENGFSISKSSIYKHTMNGTIPFRRFGKRKLVFSANELDKWVKNNE